MNVTAGFPVLDGSQVAGVRRAASWLADRLGFAESRSGQVALVATELATNLARHARGGQILLRPLDDGRGTAPSGVEILSIDKGPGIPDVALSSRDGYSTGGTLGHGLGAITRQSDLFEVFTHTSGTVAVAHLWREPLPRPVGKLEVGAVLASKPGEDVCGDAWGWRARDDRAAFFIADGLGHGLYAHEAARRGVATFVASNEHSPHRIIEDVHSSLRSTRGAAVAALVIDLERGLVHYSGLGNVSTQILRSTGTRQSLVSHNGTAGHAAHRIQEFSYPFSAADTIVMHSDGVSSQWDLAGFHGIRARHPAITAGILYRDYSRGRDDVTILVVRRRRAISNESQTQTSHSG